VQFPGQRGRGTSIEQPGVGAEGGCDPDSGRGPSPALQIELSQDLVVKSKLSSKGASLHSGAFQTLSWRYTLAESLCEAMQVWPRQPCKQTRLTLSRIMRLVDTAPPNHELLQAVLLCNCSKRTWLECARIGCSLNYCDCKRLLQYAQLSKKSSAGCNLEEKSDLENFSISCSAVVHAKPVDSTKGRQDTSQQVAHRPTLRKLKQFTSASALFGERKRSWLTCSA
jgi:hypothetical protein